MLPYRPCTSTIIGKTEKVKIVNFILLTSKSKERCVINRKIKYILFFIGIFIFLNLPFTQAGTITSTFDTDLDGWILDPTAIGSMSWVPTGGNPGGYLRIADTGPASNGALAPSKFLGDWSLLDSTAELSWDIKSDFGFFIGGIGTLSAKITGPGGEASFNSGISPNEINWTSAIAPIQEASWTVTTGTWGGLITDVAQMRIHMEFVNNPSAGSLEVNSLDNVSLTGVPMNAVPEPTTIALLGIGLVGLAGAEVRRRRKKK